MLTEMAATVGWALALDLKYPTAAGVEFSIAGYRAQSVDFRSIKCDRRGSKSSYLDAPGMDFRAEPRLPAFRCVHCCWNEMRLYPVIERTAFAVTLFAVLGLALLPLARLAT